MTMHNNDSFARQPSSPSVILSGAKDPSLPRSLHRDAEERILHCVQDDRRHEQAAGQHMTLANALPTAQLASQTSSITERRIP